MERENPTWEDLAAEWGKPAVMEKQIPALSVGMPKFGMVR
jgi:hypothetical protein